MRLVWFFLPLALAAQAETLADSLRARIGNFAGTVTLYAKNLDTGQTVGIRPTDPVRTASTIKLGILAAAFDAVAHSQATMTEPLTVTPQEKVAGSGVIGTELSDGVQLPLRDVLHLMIVLSDNTATNMMLQRLTADAVNAYLDRIGLPTTRAMRKIRGDGNRSPEAEGWSKAGRLPENQKYGLGVSTPRDMVTILEKMHRGELVSAAASKEMLDILKRCQDNHGIRRKMGDLSVANKSGALDALRSDVGIVYTKGGPIAMAITVDGMAKPDWSPDNPGLLLIADLAKLIVDGLAVR